VKPANGLRLYSVRLRARLVQECLAVLGIAAGVALLFASQVSTSSLQSSVTQLTHGIAGDATLQLIARDPRGFPESIVRQARQIPGVRVAAPLFEASANAIGPAGSESVELIGADARLAALGGTLVRHTELSPFGGIGAVVLPAPVSRALGVRRFGQELTLQIAGHTVRAPLYSQLYAKQIGSLIDSPVALAPLSYAQEMAGLSGRVSRVLIHSAPGSERRVRARLQALAAGQLNVEPLSYEQQLFTKASAAANKSTQLFSVISALVGFLFAFNAMLLTVPQRRRLIADLRRDGYTPQTVIAVLLLDALMLGVLGCALGLVLGEEISLHLFHSNPAFLSLAFAVGSERVVSLQSIAMSVGGGMGAAIIAVLSPLRDILSKDPLAAITPHRIAGTGHAGGRRALAGLLCLAASSAILLIDPQHAIAGMVALVAALLLELPMALSLTLTLTRRLACMITGAVPHVAAMELSAARARAVAITATGAIAVFGSVAIQGAHSDLLEGLEGAARETNAFTDVWVSPAGSYNLLKTTPFVATDTSELARLPGVRSVGVYRSGLLDWGERRVLVIAPPRAATPLLPAGQILQGNVAAASAKLRAGGWAVVSQALASEHDLRIGESFRAPTPVRFTLRVAALSTNIGWAPGAIIMNAEDYASAWGTQDASAYAVRLLPGTSPSQGVREIEHALGPPSRSGLGVQSAAQQVAQQQALSRTALARLTQIATLIPIAAVLAMAAAMGAMIWQRRPRLAKLKLEGLPRTELWRTILLESFLMLAVGCLMGAVFGLYGQQLADHALASVVNFPVLYSVTALSALESLAIVIAAALSIVAVPGYFAASVPAALALQD